MTQRDTLFAALAAYGAATDQVEAILVRLQAAFPGQQVYVFQSDSAGGAGGGARSARTIMAFATPDVALHFAQRNRLLADGTMPRLRRLALPSLLLAMARDPSITTVRLVHDDAAVVVGALPDGITITRSEIMQAQV